MALAADTISGDDDGLNSGGKPPSRRPLYILAVLGVAGAVGILLHTFAGQAAESPKPPAPEDQPLIVPDDNGLEKLEPVEDAAVELGDPSDIPVPEESTDTSSVVETPTGVDANKRLEKLQEELFVKHLLEVQQQQLELRKKALVAPSAVREYGEAMREKAAENAALMRELGGAGAGDDEGAFADMMGPLQALAGARGAGAAGVVGAGGAGGAAEAGRDPTLAQEKRAFFANGGAQLRPGQLEHEVRKQETPYELQMGDVIPGMLISGINSEGPGQIVGQVTENVCDSVTGNHLLIPQGSKLVGTYSASVSQGQARIQVVWVRLRLPNGDKLDLDGMSGADQMGVAGFRDRVNRHWVKRLAAALLATSFTVAYELTAPRGASFYGSAVHRGVGENIVNLGTEMAREEGQLPPTLEIRPGYRFNIMVNKDVVFPGPYKGAGKRSGRC